MGCTKSYFVYSVIFILCHLFQPCQESKSFLSTEFIVTRTTSQPNIFCLALATVCKENAFRCFPNQYVISHQHLVWPKVAIIFKIQLFIKMIKMVCENLHKNLKNIEKLLNSRICRIILRKEKKLMF